MKILKKVCIAVICAALIVSAAWFAWRHAKYSAYTGNMQYDDTFSTLFVPRYIHKDAEGFDFNVKYPDIMSLTGNLAVGMPGTPEDPFTDGLIIWPEFGGGYTYGVILNDPDGDTGWQIYIDRDGTAVDPEMQPIIDAHRETVDILLKKAFELWKIE